MTKGFIIDGNVVTEFIQVTLKKPNTHRKRTSCTHKYLDGFLNEKSSSKITMKEFYEYYYSRKEKAFTVIEETDFIALIFEN